LGDPLFHVDAFTEQPFAGNPAGVCILSRPRDDAWMQAIASEMNLAETAFLERAPEAWSLRWFTPTVEVDLCGHATLASAHVLWEEGRVARGQPIGFDTRSGRLTAAPRAGLIELDFPAEPATAGPAPVEILEALPVSKALSTGRNRLDYLIEVEDEATVRRLAPDFKRLAAACGANRGVECEAGVRFRLALLRAGRGHRRGSGHGLDALLPGPVLGGTPRKDRARRIPGIRARGRGPRAPGRRACLPGRARRDRRPWRAGLNRS
jgi:predicted PhzF superfamily epimerase YddE/YHI9